MRMQLQLQCVGRLKVRVLPYSQDLLPVIDAFDAAAGQVKVETEGEKKIAESYQVAARGSYLSIAAMTMAAMHPDQWIAHADADT